MSEEIQPATSHSTALFRSIKLVAWSFLGVRSKQGYHDDLSKVNPLHVVIVGILGTFLLVIGLIVLVNWVTAK